MEGCDTGSTQNVVVISPQRPVLQQNLLGVKVLGLPLLLVRGFQFVRRQSQPSGTNDCACVLLASCVKNRNSSCYRLCKI